MVGGLHTPNVISAALVLKKELQVHTRDDGKHLSIITTNEMLVFFLQMKQFYVIPILSSTNRSDWDAGLQLLKKLIIKFRKLIVVFNGVSLHF